MKILQIINSHALQDGGAQRLALELHRAYRARGHDAHLLSILPSPTGESGTYSLGFASAYRAAVLPRLIRFLRQKRWRDVEIIHVHLFPAQLWVALALLKIRPRARVITTEHNTFNRRRASRAGRWLDRFTLRAYQKIVCVSRATQTALETWQPQARAKLVTIENGIDLTKVNAPTAKNADSTPIILAVGRIAAQKNYGAALRAIAQLAGADFRFQIAGQDEMNGQMQELARELGIADHVEFLGYRGDVATLLQNADIFLLSSHWEGLSLAIVEAMAAGLPVVVPDVAGMREVVASDGALGEIGGCLIAPNAPETIAAALSLLLQDADLRQNLGAKAHARAAHFNIERTIEAHLQLYRRLVETAR